MINLDAAGLKPLRLNLLEETWVDNLQINTVQGCYHWLHCMLQD